MRRVINCANGLWREQPLTQRCSGPGDCPDREQSRVAQLARKEQRWIKTGMESFSPWMETQTCFYIFNFWCASNSHLLQSYRKRFLIGVKYKLKCLETLPVIQRRREGVFKHILEKEGGSKIDLEGVWATERFGLQEWAHWRSRRSVLQMGAAFPDPPWACV